MFLTEKEAERRLLSSDNLLNKLACVSSNLEPLKLVPGSLKPKEEKTNGATPSNVKASSVPSQLIERTPEKRLSRLASKADKTGTVQSYIKGNEQIIKRASPNSEAFIRATERLDEVRDIALGKLILAVNSMTDDKFKNADLKELSTVAANLSRVVDKSLPQDSDGSQGQTNIVIYAPQLSDESQFKTMEIASQPIP